MRTRGAIGRWACSVFSLSFCISCSESSTLSEIDRGADPLGANSAAELPSASGEDLDADGGPPVVVVAPPAPGEPPPPFEPRPGWEDFCGRGIIEDALTDVAGVIDCGLIPSDAGPASDVVIAARTCVIDALASNLPFKLYDDRHNEALQGRAAYYWNVQRQRPVQVGIQTSNGCGQSETTVCERLVQSANCESSVDKLCLECQGVIDAGVCCALCAE